VTVAAVVGQDGVRVAWRCECADPDEHVRCCVEADKKIRHELWLRVGHLALRCWDEACARGAAPDADANADGERVIELELEDPRAALAQAARERTGGWAWADEHRTVARVVLPLAEAAAGVRR